MKKAMISQQNLIRQNQSSIIFFALLILAGAVYQGGWSGTLHYDDEQNLAGLYGISDLQSALVFAVSGESGPTGRPISLLSFSIQNEAWPDPKPFLVANTVLHLLNGILVFMFIRLLFSRMEKISGEYFALLIASIWLMSPFLASASLIVVQRMTGLSAFFLFITLNLYLFYRPKYRVNYKSDIFLSFLVAVGCFTAGFSKENGFLIPVFILLIELLIVPTWDHKPVAIRPQTKFFLFVLPLIFIVIYLAYRGLSPGAFDFRDYSSGERLMTQTRVMFYYMQQLLFPSVTGVTPFHDDWVASRHLFDPISTFAALIGLIFLGVLAWSVRKKTPLVTFGISWFFAGHLLESTTLALDLVFPHRNYVPSVGLYIAIIALAYHAFKLLNIGKLIAQISGALYLSLFVIVLSNATNLWGNKLLSAEMWYIEKRESVRAAQYLFNYYLNDGQTDVAEQINNSLMNQFDGNLGFSFQSLTVCDQSRDAFLNKISRVEADLINAPIITLNIAAPIQRFSAFAGHSDCPHFGISEADRLISAAEPGSRPIQKPASVALLFARAQIADHKGDYQEAANFLERSLDIMPTLDAAQLVPFYLVQAGLESDAISFLEGIIDKPPVGPFQSSLWKMRLSEILDTLQASDTTINYSDDALKY